MLYAKGKAGLLAGAAVVVGLVTATEGRAQHALATGSDAPQLEEIVVTARKREETLQDVPVAVTALSGAAITATGAVDVRDLARLAPGLFYQAADPSKPQLFVRGVGTRSFDAGAESSIATFVDGVYMGRFSGHIQSLADVERVEVLKGPQGALFGRNTIGGAINVVTRKPGPEFAARASATYGRASHFDGEEFNASAMLSGPLAESLSGQLSLSHTGLDGQTLHTNRAALRGGGGLNTIRGRVVWAFAEDWDADFIVDHYRSDGASGSLRSNTLGGLRPNVLLQTPGAVAPVDPDPYKTQSTPGTGDIFRQGQGASATIAYAGPGFGFVSISAYRNSEVRANLDTDGTILANLERQDYEKSWQLSQELRLSSTPGGVLTLGDRVDWLVGAYYFRESADLASESRFGPNAVTVLGPNRGVPYTNLPLAFVDTESVALFAQLGVKLTERLKLDLALRYSHDDKTANLSMLTTASIPALGAPYAVRLTPSYQSTDPSISVSYKASDTVLVYASYASGFKGGAFQFLAATPQIAGVVAKPESVDAYQAGVKSELFGRRLRANLAVFQYDYTNIQVPRIEVPPGGIVPAALTTNAGRSTIKGAELEGVALLGGGLSVEYGLAWLRARYDRYVFSPALDFSGNVMPRSPKWTADLAVVYTTPVPLGDLTLRGSLHHSDHVYFEPDNAKVDPGTREPGYTTFDARASIRRGAYTVTLWGKNLTDEEYRATVLNLSGSRLLELWAPRRTYGVTVSASW